MDNNFMNEYNLNINMDVEILNKYWVSQKNTPDVWFDVKLKTTLLTQSDFIFSESSYFHLKFGIK